ncbi:MAG: cbb3-type cytochrome oxidase assembly protein CcoS [Bacteroidota bacterium]|nr:MAG: cbb3-type cytochrome oxidase assembly protein CcoS [Bacteroidota bacterium]
MSVLIILIGASLVVAAGFLVSLFWAVRSGQYDDDYSPSVRILFDNDKTLTSDKSNSNITDN